MKPLIFFLVLAITFNTHAQVSPADASAPLPAPTCGIRFLNDFKKHYGLVECLSRGDKLCISERVNEKSTTAIASTAGAAGAAARLAASKIAPTAIRKGAETAGTRLLWAAAFGGAYFIATKAVGGVVGFFADTTEAGDCRDNHPWILYVKGERRCEVAYKIVDNPVAANFFNLKNESEQLDLLRDARICDYFYKLHLLVKAKGETVAAEQNVETPGLFRDSPEETKTTPKTSRLPQKPKTNIDASSRGTK